MKLIHSTGILILLFLPVRSLSQDVFPPSPVTQVVLLGTGTPNPSPDRSGPSVAVVVHDTPYLVDFGPGVVRRAAALSPRYGGSIKGLAAKNLKHAFLTHLHSDHTAGYPDLILTPWVMGRDAPLEVYGPEGLRNMTDHILEAYREDIRYRLYGMEPANNEGWRVNAHEFREEGVVYRDSNVTVEAFPVQHGTWPNAWGYRFTTPDRVIVISGDTRPTEKIVEYARGADILIHEVYSHTMWEKKDDFWKTYHRQNHTSTLALGRIAAQARPRLVVLYHILSWGADDDDLLKEIAREYDGRVVVGKDLDVF